jgi:solute carrier family 25 phosphate transporter 3
MKTIIGKDGVPSLLKGAGPTMVGYALQGSLKYGIYEFLKPIVAASIIASTDTSSIRSTILDLLISGALAETVGSSVLTPFEAARIRLVSYPDYGDGGGVGSCLYRMVREGGFRSLFLGYPAIVAKQIPYTAASLCTFEIASKYIYSQVLGVGTAIVTNPTIGSAVAQGVIGGEINTSYGDATVITSIATAIVTMESIPSLTRFEVTFTAASAAALIGAVVSQPGDTLLSVINNKTRIITMENKAGLQEGEGASSSPVSPVNMEEEGFSPAALMVETARELGVRGLYTGFKARLLHVMTIVVSQLLIYDYTKQVVGSIIH